MSLVTPKVLRNMKDNVSEGVLIRMGIKRVEKRHHVYAEFTNLNSKRLTGEMSSCISVFIFIFTITIQRTMYHSFILSFSKHLFETCFFKGFISLPSLGSNTEKDSLQSSLSYPALPMTQSAAVLKPDIFSLPLLCFLTYSFDFCFLLAQESVSRLWIRARSNQTAVFPDRDNIIIG